MNRNWAVVAAALYFLTATIAQGQDADAIRAKLDKAKLTHDAQLDRCREAVFEVLEKREEAARRVGDKKQVDRIKAERLKFEEQGELPKSLPASLRRKFVTAHSSLENAYAAAVKEFTKAKLDDDAEDTERELEKFRNDPVLNAGGVSRWTQLFNGKDLSGWKQHPEDKSRWFVEEGVLVGTGSPGYLFSEHDRYSDFRLQVEALISDGGNSGLFVRSEYGTGVPNGYESQINSNQPGPKTGTLFVLLPGARPGTAPPIATSAEPPKPNEWFQMEMLAKGDQITVMVNGKQVLDYRDAKRTYTSGHVALQVYSGRVRFRKIQVKEVLAE